MTNAKRNFNYNMINNTIEGYKSAIERANKGIEPEFSELMEMMAKCPTFTVVAKKRDEKKTKETYRGLTIKKMEAYILIYCGEDELKKFNNVCEVGKALGKKYIEAKRWFLKNHKSLLDRAEMDKLSDDVIAEKYQGYVSTKKEMEAKATKTEKANGQIVGMNTKTNNEEDAA